MTALQELRTVLTNANGDEIRIYDQYRYHTGSLSGRTFIGYLVDNGKDRTQAPTWLDALKLAGANGPAWTKKEQSA